MGMACSSEVRAAAAIAEDVGFDSLPCPPFSDSFRNWCPHHYWAYENLLLLLLLLLLLKIWGYLVYPTIVHCPCIIKGAGDEDSLIRHPTIYISALTGDLLVSSSG